MKPSVHSFLFAFLLLVSTTLSMSAVVLPTGDPGFKSIGPLTFGPDGILFAADTKSAAIVAIDTQDTKEGKANGSLKVEGINHKIGALLGASADQVLINDLVVNPTSGNVYLAVSRGRGPDAMPVLIRVDGKGALKAIDLKKVKHAKATLSSVPADRVTGEGRRRRNARSESITDIAFLDGKVLVAGLANEEFASSLRAIPFPFEKGGEPTSVEIFHGAHGRFETRSPVRTFVPFHVDGKPQLLAAYTCTPLVQFPLSEVKPNAKIKGKTIAELGNRNRPLDMIVYKKDGKDFLLIANNARGIMKVNAGNLAQAEKIESRVSGGKTAGVTYETIEGWKGIDQLDRLSDSHAVVVLRGEGEALHLEARLLP